MKKMGKLTDKNHKTYERFFNVAYFTAKKGRSFTNFSNLLTLEKHYGVES